MYHVKRNILFVFIKIGKGGYLFLGAGSNLDDQALAHDIFMIMLHAPWNGEWLIQRLGQYDSESKTYLISGGKTAGTETITLSGSSYSNLTSLYIKILLLAYDSESPSYVIEESINEYIL